nr:PREDICTED: DDB1- and CUL4-associated factor 10-like isoform X1 [Struthio camelus australis]
MYQLCINLLQQPGRKRVIISLEKDVKKLTEPKEKTNKSVLTVACEQTEVLLFDPISSKHIKTLSEAHEDCVNNIRFLDNRLFATCSDDTTIALWDLRKLNTKVCTLHGHTSWVKNIEYDTNTRLLVTSGFDGNVIIWDTNRYVCICVLLHF